MKRIFALILAGVIWVAAVACVDRSDAGSPAGTDGWDDRQDQSGVYTVTAGYDYGMHRTDLATILYDMSTLFFALPDGFDPPVAGDTFAITYSGRLLVMDTYPSMVQIEGGKVEAVAGTPAVIFAVKYYPAEGDSPARLVTVDADGSEYEDARGYPEYYIADVEGHFAPLSDLTEPTALYASVPANTDTDGGAIAGLYAYAPR